MKLRTSFFNPTVLKKDITRFAPVWTLYGVFLLILFVGVEAPNQVANALTGMSFVNFFYAGICASVLFGDLFQSRMCNALHALPMRRECWFVTHAIAGFLFSLVPNVIATLALYVALEEYFAIALIWLAVMTLQYLFFFGVACFSVMCAGNRIGMCAVYGIINLLSLLVFVLVEEFYEPLLYGIDIGSAGFDWFCPLVFFLDADFIDYRYSNISDTFLIDGFVWEDWFYLGIIAVVGLGLLVAAVAPYRRRRLEVAGDFMALRPLQPVFLVIYTLGVGVFLYGINELFSLEMTYGFMALGIVIGFFTGRMLLERTVRVFRPKSILTCVLFVTVFGGSLLITWLDPLGITRQIPNTEDVAYVRLFSEDDTFRYMEPEATCLQAESAEDIEQIRYIHQTLLDEHYDVENSGTPIVIHYQRKDGTTLTRYYSMKSLSAVYEPVVNHLSSPEYLFSPDDAPVLHEYVRSIWCDKFRDDDTHFSGSIDDPVLTKKLVDAILADCEAGHMAQHYSLNIAEAHVAYVDISTWLPLFFEMVIYEEIEEGYLYDDYSVRLRITTACTNTVKVLEEIAQQLEQEENY